MKSRRFIAVLIIFIAITIVACCVHWQQIQPMFKKQTQSLLKDVTWLTIAAQSYSRGHVSHKQPLLTSISLQDLVNGGYVSATDIRAFDGVSVTIYPTDVDTYPNFILIHMQLPDGSLINVMADGSIQQKAR